MSNWSYFKELKGQGLRAEDEDEDEDGEPKEKQKENPGASPIAQKLYESRTIIISGGINQKLAASISAQLITLAAESDDPIKLFINSQGGHVEAGDTIFDMIRFVSAPVQIIGTGWVASAGALIYAAVPVEQRFSLPHTRYMLHQPMGGVRGQASDISIEAQEILKMRERLNNTFADATGQPLDRIERDTERNFWMSAEEAQGYGLVGKLLKKSSDLS